MSTTAMSSMVKTMTSTPGPVVRPKKVEVRWLESESELYLKQWQHRYHQLVGLDSGYRHHHKNGRQLSVGADPSLDDPFDDWCLSSKSLLDLDIDFDFSDSKMNNIIISNCNPSADDSTGSPLQPTNPLKTTITSFDHIFWSTDDHFGDKHKNKKNKRIKSSIEDKSLNLSCDSSAFDDEEIVLTVDGYVIRQKTGGIVTTEEDDESFGDSSYENQRFSPIKRVVHKSKASGSDCNKNEIVLTEKERQFSIDLSKKLELLAKDQALNEQNGDPQTNKAIKPKPSRARDRTRPPRPRPPPIRRQIFKCEHIGCSYQSDRNFNFLRHKRTHCKNKTEDESKIQSVATVATTNGQPTTTAVLADISGVKSTQTLVIINSNNSSTSHPNSCQTLKVFANHNNIGNSSTNLSDPLITSASQALATTSEANTNTIVNITSVVSAEELQAIKTSIDCLLNNCDTTEDNLKIANSSCDENHSYHPKVLFV